MLLVLFKSARHTNVTSHGSWLKVARGGSYAARTFLALVHHHFGIDRGTGRSGCCPDRAGAGAGPKCDCAAITCRAAAEPGRSANALDRGPSGRECDRRDRAQAIAPVGAEHQAQQRTRSSTRSSPKISGSYPTSPCPTRRHEFRASRSTRNGGEASRVLLRGLDRTYYTTTYNGREIFTAETRSVALQDFPVGAISAVEAFKTSTANLVEPGLAGLINVRSRRPFDFKGFEVAGSVWGIIRKPVARLQAQRQILVTDRWRAGRRRDRRADQLLLHAASLSGFDPPPRLLHRRPRRAAVRPICPKFSITRATAGGRRSTARCSGGRRRISSSTPRACGRAIASELTDRYVGSSRSGAAANYSQPVVRRTARSSAAR